MTIVKALRKMFLALTGLTPTGSNITDVITSGSKQLPNVKNLVTEVNTLKGSVVQYGDNRKYFVLNSSTTNSTKQFKITVIDDGTVTATEITTS